MSMMADMMGHLTDLLLREESVKQGGWNTAMDAHCQEIFERLTGIGPLTAAWISENLAELESKDWQKRETARENVASFLVRLSGRRCSMDQAVLIVDTEPALLRQMFHAPKTETAISGN